MTKVNFKVGDKVEVVRVDLGDPFVVGDVFYVIRIDVATAQLDAVKPWHVTHDQIKRV